MGNGQRITWHTEQRKLGELIEWDKNPRQLNQHDAEHLQKSLDSFGVADPLIVNTDNKIIGGHMRRRVMLRSGYKPDDIVDVRVPDRELTEREAEELAMRAGWAEMIDQQGDRECLWTWKRMCEKTRVIWQRQ